MRRVKILALVVAMLLVCAPIAWAESSMDVLPGREGRRPGVFLVHGGWWSEGDKSALTPIARRYAALGYAVFNVNYRLSGTATWPAQRDDVIDAIARARAHPARYRFDPSRYVVVGFSAGGHLAAAVAVHNARPPGLRGVVGLSPVTSPHQAWLAGARLRSAAVALAGCPPVRCPSTWSSMEPAKHAGPGDAPALLLHTEHEFVPAAFSLALARRLPGAEVRILDGSAHSTRLYARPSVAHAVEHWIASALR